jgi:hypothetical protein
MNCRVCGDYLDRIITLHYQPSQVQHLEGMHLTDLVVARCIRCGLLQLENFPVPYWAEEIDTAPLSPSLTEFLDGRASTHRRDFFSRHRLEHQPSPMVYLSDFRGTGEITVPNIVGLPVEEFVADHLLYFNKDTFEATLRQAGFDILHMEVVWHDQILSALVHRPTCVVWGAGHQALSVIRLYGLRPDYIVDSAEFKHGRIVFGAEIVGPEKIIAAPPEILYVMAGGYTDEVCKQARKLYGGRMVRFDDGRFVDTD